MSSRSSRGKANKREQHIYKSIAICCVAEIAGSEVGEVVGHAACSAQELRMRDWEGAAAASKGVDIYITPTTLFSLHRVLTILTTVL
jgi:hypothetical protein